MADFAGDVDVRQEVHLDLYYTISLARFAPAAFYIEGKSSRRIAPHLRLVRLGEQVADRRENAGVGGRVGPRRAADGRLVDVDDLVDVLDPQDLLMFARFVLRPVHLLGHALVQDLVDERRLAGTGYAGDAGEGPQGDIHVDVLQIVFRSAANRKVVAVAGAPVLRGRRSFLPDQVLTRDGFLAGLHFLQRALHHQVAAFRRRHRVRCR